MISSLPRDVCGLAALKGNERNKHSETGVAYSGQDFSPFARLSFLDPAMPLSTEDFLQRSLHERGIHPTLPSHTVTDLERQGIEEPKVIRVSGM